MSDSTAVIGWTPEMLKRFKAAHSAAVIDKAETFMFDGNEIVTSYGKYLIQYLDTKFGK